MATGSFILPPLRGYVPDGELDVQYDLPRKALALEIPMWEGCDVPHMRSRIMPGDGLTWVRPGLIGGQEPIWNQAFPGVAGAPKSGHIAQRVWAAKENVPGGGGWRYEGIWDQPTSQFIVKWNFAVLVVGQPMVYMNPGMAPAGRGFSYRDFIVFKGDGEIDYHRMSLEYETETIKWRFLAAQADASPILPFYGLRVAMLFVNGDEGGATGNPRVFIGYDDGEVKRADFPMPSYTMAQSNILEMFANSKTAMKLLAIGGGCWEYFAYFVRSFEEDEARALCRDALGLVKWDPYVARRIGWEAPGPFQLTATPGSYGRVAVARAYSFGRVAADPSIYQRVSATPAYSGPRVAASPNSFPRVSARIRIAAEEVFDVQATPLCPSEMNWEADNVLELADVLDDMQTPPAEITSATLVTCEIYDRGTGLAVTASPVTLNQVGSTNTWRESVLTNAANGFAHNQRLLLVFIFDGGAGLHGRFTALAVVGSATS